MISKKPRSSRLLSAEWLSNRWGRLIFDGPINEYKTIIPIGDGQRIHHHCLQQKLKKDKCIDLSSFIPIWATLHNLCVYHNHLQFVHDSDSTDLVDLWWFKELDPDIPLRPKLTHTQLRQTIDAQLRQRKLLLRILPKNQPDWIRQMDFWLNSDGWLDLEADADKLWFTDYDMTIFPDSYERLYTKYQGDIDRRTIIRPSNNIPLCTKHCLPPQSYIYTNYSNPIISKEANKKISFNLFKMIILLNQYRKILMMFLKWNKTTLMMKFHFSFYAKKRNTKRF